MFKKQAGRRGGTVNETRFSNGLSSNEEPKHQNTKESVKTDPRSKTCKEKITNVVGAFSGWKNLKYFIKLDAVDD